MGGIIAAVQPDSLAARAELRAGDELLSINGHTLRDEIDVRFYAADERLSMRWRRDGELHESQLERRYGEPLGLAFVEPLFDGVRRCTNQCEFCFVKQMPPGLRRSLYVKDDDYRLSFLSGSYVTLTNLTPEDWGRIEEQRLSPLYVSVHATEPNVRREALRNPTAPAILPQLRRLIDMGIELHTQIVVTPGLNDGQHLERSIEDLAELFPGVRSVSVVPVGLTKFHRGQCRVHTEAEMRVVLQQVEQRRDRLQERLGVSFVYLSDEWYLKLGERVPPLSAYDGLDLTEDGVGLTRHFIDEWREMETEERLRRRKNEGSMGWVTGALFAPVLEELTEGLASVEVIGVTNRFFGETVTVAGLLAGGDVLEALKGRPLPDVVVLPSAMFAGPGGETLDGMLPVDLEEELNRPVVLSRTLLGRLKEGQDVLS